MALPPETYEPVMTQCELGYYELPNHSFPLCAIGQEPVNGDDFGLYDGSRAFQNRGHFRKRDRVVS